jgi:hypothetical protein
MLLSARRKEEVVEQIHDRVAGLDVHRDIVTASALDARGHKQTYWVALAPGEPPPITGNVRSCREPRGRYDDSSSKRFGGTDPGSFPSVTSLPDFDFPAFFAAFDAGRRDRGLSWYEFADELWQQSAELNSQRLDHPLCGGAVSRLGTRGETSCQYALFMLRWLGRAPEDFLTGPVVDVGDVRLPEPGPDSRLRWDLNQLHAALNEQRQERGLTWTELAQELGCTPSRLTNLRTARMADMHLTMRITQWLGKPAATFIHATQW